MRLSLPGIWNDFISLFFPQICQACDKALFEGEEVICIQCQYELPRTDFHKTPDNPVAKTFWGRIDVKQASSFFYFHAGGKVQRLIHRLKYYDKTIVGSALGRMYGTELNGAGNYVKPDFVHPVPLHPKKLHQRGYNQSTYFAEGIAEALGIPVRTDILKRISYTGSQTKKTREERWLNVKDAFVVGSSTTLNGKHILLVDDVITTGATLEAGAQRLRDAGATVSIAAIAYAESAG